MLSNRYHVKIHLAYLLYMYIFIMFKIQYFAQQAHYKCMPLHKKSSSDNYKQIGKIPLITK